MARRRTHIEQYNEVSSSFETICGHFVFREGKKHYLIDNSGMPLPGHNVVSNKDAAQVPEIERCLVCYGLNKTSPAAKGKEQ